MMNKLIIYFSSFDPWICGYGSNHGSGLSSMVDYGSVPTSTESRSRDLRLFRTPVQNACGVHAYLVLVTLSLNLIIYEVLYVTGNFELFPVFPISLAF